MEIYFLLLLPVIVLMGGAILWLWALQRANKRPPFTKNFLRSPGETLRKKLEDLAFEMMESFYILLALPAYLAVGWLLAGRKQAGFFFATFLIIFVYACYRFIKVIDRIRRTRLGWEGERVVGEELNLLMLQGYRVFHDVPKEIRGNVDHVVVGANGVFAVETKAKSKVGKGDDVAKIAFDGKCLIFPGGYKSTEPLEQAKRHAAWVSNWLTEATGETVAVTPVVIYPGWYISYTAASKGVFVLAGGAIQKLFPTLPGQNLKSEQIQRISHQLDQLCRSVKPWKPEMSTAA